MDLKLHIPSGNLESKENEPDFYDLLCQTENKTFAFFSDTLKTYIVLKSNVVSQEEFQDMVQQYTSIDFKITLSAHNGDDDIDPDVIASAHLDTTNIVKQSTLENGTHYIIWQYSTDIKYPQRKMINPSAAIFVRLNIKSSAPSRLQNGDSEQNQAEEALISSNNLLAGINSGITTLSLSDPIISEDMIEDGANGLNLNKSLPSIDSVTSNSLDESSFIRSSSSEVVDHSNKSLLLQSEYSIPLLSLLSMRLKSKKLISSNNSILSTLEIRSPKFTTEKNIVLEVSSVNLVLSNGDVEPVEHDRFPLQLEPGSILKSLYRLTNNDSKSMKLVSIQVLAKMKEKVKKNLYQDISTAINTKWDTHIDFAVPGTVPRPSTPAKSYSSPTKPTTPQFLGRKQDLKLSLRNTSVANLKQKPKLPAFAGLSISFSSPSKVAVGSVFKWKVQAINKGNASMNLTLIIQPPSDLIFEKKMPDPPSINNRTELPIFSSGTLFKSYQSLKPTTHGIIALRNDINIGPLEHGALYECEIDLLAFEKGVHTLKGLKLVDRINNQIVECGRLPVLIVN
ncbi:Trafficking protein particle complex II-specific subunit 65 [Komagataella phaffii CBS 7435]|uniref:Trafficking protein particle complex II-specific subunit 65 IgD3 domain-containing protein n=2 Tax=Komagataella phaffii TaxID=460519 RepID=C4R8Q7_KOMPG|nr:Hypothetical protein PAS_chr4_0721 [Komagataella phaffii GS115]AOA65257.1 GQ67_05101T0 [Komagataella phaffii]CAH2450615.1 Trafficking protein particle complex II-specific subunit 65 [Komagataella phaffii CBS 7435]AOA70272.1 GQ68_05083T0 [Komagataella phaffii GS115]CAY71982.1 Hypothetical protein PAS_chr4_0721 [Komagataella phaffii GS115]CCA40417.1 Trafficking protein particle complex II-specific subunit 65 [Komagataella phaffii CBS 7435]